MIVEAFEDKAQVLLVLLRGRAGNEDINICVAEVESLKYLIDEPLERLRGVAQSKWHLQELIETEGCDNGSFGDVRWLNQYLMVGPYQVNLGEDTAAMERCRKVLYVKNRVSVWDGHVIECPVIPTGTPVTRGLFGHQVQG